MVLAPQSSHGGGSETEPSAEQASPTVDYFAGSRLFKDDDWAQLAQRLHLSARELQVVKGVFDDHKETAIASELGISHHTVNTYLQRVYHKLNVANRSQLIVSVVSAYFTMTSTSDTPDPCPVPT